jgi:hypothetical protein
MNDATDVENEITTLLLVDPVINKRLRTVMDR